MQMLLARKCQGGQSLKRSVLDLSNAEMYDDGKYTLIWAVYVGLKTQLKKLLYLAAKAR